MNAFIIAAMVVFGILGIIWAKNGWLNILLKTTFTGFFIWGLVLTLIILGYVVKV